MPSSYTLSCRFTLQATGENNNTWGVILNTGVFALVDYALAGRLTFALSGSKTLTTALGATDEARAAFIDVSGGSGGQVVIPAISKGYYVRNAAVGQLVVTAGGVVNATFQAGDIGPVFTDGANTYPLMLSNKPIGQYIRDGDQAVIDYVNLAISGGSIALPPATPVGAALMVRAIGLPPTNAWIPSFITTADVSGLVTALATIEDEAVAWALTL